MPNLDPEPWVFPLNGLRAPIPGMGDLRDLYRYDPRPGFDRGCQWFAYCTNDATGTQSHPILGEVPICDRCQGIYDGMAGA